jgi:hypothetical protein
VPLWLELGTDLGHERSWRLGRSADHNVACCVADVKVSGALKNAIIQGRTAKKMTQAQLAQVGWMNEISSAWRQETPLSARSPIANDRIRLMLAQPQCRNQY